jgi:hypothetical protein
MTATVDAKGRVTMMRGKPSVSVKTPEGFVLDSAAADLLDCPLLTDDPEFAVAWL